MNQIKQHFTVTYQDWDRLSIFTLLWGCAYFFHLIHVVVYNHIPSAPLMVIGAVLCLAFPTRLWALLAAAALQLSEYFIIIPRTSNHYTLMAIVNLSILAVAGYLLLRRRCTREGFYDWWSGVVRWQVLVFYFFATFHKINTGFFDQQISCGIDLTRQLVHIYRIPIPRNWFWLGIPITFIAEAGIPVLLFFRRTRLWGILTALVFHYVLAMILFYDFSSVIYALMWVWMPSDIMERLQNRLPIVVTLLSNTIMRLALLAAFLIVALRRIYGAGFELRANTPTAALYGALLIIGFLLIFRRDLIRVPSFPGLHLASPWLGILVLILFINGAAPYIGFKTQSSFEMFSNLQMEGDVTNHLIIPGNLRLLPYMDRIVFVRDTNYEHLQRQPFYTKGYGVTEHELYRWLDDEDWAAATIERDGEWMNVQAASYGQELEPIHPLALKFMVFREYRPDDPPQCRW